VDFTALRVYTWYVKKSRYETAFIENNLCGQLPVSCWQRAQERNPSFASGVMDGNKEERIFYHLNQTVVRRIRDASAASGKHGSPKAGKDLRQDKSFGSSCCGFEQTRSNGNPSNKVVARALRSRG